MRIIAFLNVLRGELDFANLVIARLARQRADLELVAFDCHHVEVVQVNRVARIGDDRAHIAGQKIFVFANSENERAAASRANDEIGDVSVNNRDAVGADDLFQGRAHGIDQTRLGIFPVQLLVNAPDEVSKHLGVGLRVEIMVAVTI